MKLTWFSLLGCLSLLVSCTSEERLDVSKYIGKWVYIGEGGEDLDSQSTLEIVQFGQKFRLTMILDGKKTEGEFVGPDGTYSMVVRTDNHGTLSFGIVRSIEEVDNGAISLYQVTGVEDFSVGVFQRESVVQKLGLKKPTT